MEKAPRKQTILIYIALGLLGIIAFEEVRKCGFVYDDSAYVTENKNVLPGLTRQSIVWAFTHSHVGNWHPVTSISHLLDCQLFGPNPLGHHLVNLLLHITNSLLLYWILKKMTGATWPSAFAAAVFALHPLRVESVAWVSERKDLLSGLFWMLTIAAYTGYAGRTNVTNYLLVVLTFSLALMSKPMVVTLPFVLLLLDYWPLGRFEKRFNGAQKNTAYCKTAMRLTLEKIPLLVPAAVVSTVTFLIQKSSGALFTLQTLPISTRIANALVCYVSYLGKMIWPRHLAVLYPHPLGNPPAWQVVISLLILAGISILVIYSARHRRYLLTGWLWYLGTLVPVIGLVQVGSQAMADRYTYLPSIGINIIVAWGIAEIPAKWSNKKTAAAVLTAITLSALIVCTRLQVRHWENKITLYGHAVSVTKKNYMMHNNYGTALCEAARFDEAVEQYKQAVQIKPNYFEARVNLGKTLLTQKKFQQAVEYFTNLLRLKPDHIETSTILIKTLLYVTGDIKAAVREHYRMLQLRPDRAETLNNLAWLLATTEDANLANPADALKFAQRACELTDFNNPQMLDTLAAAQAADGRFAEAAATAEKAIESAQSQNKKQLLGQIEERLKLYKANQPYRD